MLDFDAFVNEVASAIALHVADENPLEAAVPRPPREAYILDHEKIVWHFPDTASRIMEDPR